MGIPETNTEKDLDSLLAEINALYNTEFDKLAQTVKDKDELLDELTYNRQELHNDLETAINNFVIPNGTKRQIKIARLILQTKALKYLIDYSSRFAQLRSSWED